MRELFSCIRARAYVERWLSINGPCCMVGTSKVYNASMSNSASAFGFRGEGEYMRYRRSHGTSSPLTILFCICIALASAADLCCLEIASRTVNSRETWSVILKVG